MVRTLVRRFTKTMVVGGLAYLVATWFRSRDPQVLDDTVPGTAQWPPLGGGATTPSVPAEEGTVVTEPSDGAAADAPQGDWIAPDAEGDCPVSHPFKAKLRSGIYHVPNGASYDRTNADRCYASTNDAEADGYRASKT